MSMHDKKVKKIAGGYKGQGWKVQADVPGYPKPKNIFGKRPDVIATKGKRIRITEVETCGSYKKDTPQRSAFKRYTNLDPKKRQLRTRIAKKGDRC